ncbi:nuclear transport factor 2 family protein [Streptomyces sp. NBC_00365]|uniref:nuclear transport factor 2 family protein n=1 Tax=Streptomyces sp. NBC_00365 TaxID=2975726 RepID=UPI00225191D2|nr:nuclear transport factor 2 family protein [Streptomyces sp. NBC_00365]MCX5095880.1 nuclear transport factor 2 family protein [Streptomyces sp. NBC_00365]
MSTALSVTDRNREIIRALYEIVGRGALTELGSYFSDDYTYTQPAGSPLPGQWRGAEADAAWGRLFEMCGHRKVTVREIVADGPHRVAGLVHVEGVAQDGSAWATPVTELYWVEDGKITDVRPFYWDLVELRRAADVV